MSVCRMLRRISKRRFFIFFIMVMHVKSSAHTQKDQWVKKTYSNAKRKCHLSRVLVENLSEFETCWGSTSLVRNKTFWIPILRKSSGVWIHPSGECFSNEIIPLGARVPGQDCTVMRTEDGFLDEIYCYEKTLGYVCSINDVDECPMKAECLKTQRYSYAVFREQVTWFDAYEKCKSMGLTLASIDSHEKSRKETLEEVKANISKHGHYSMAVIYSVWVPDYQGKPHIGTLEKFHWAEGEPQPNNDCALAYFYGGKWQWNSTDCTELHYLLCSEDLTENCGFRLKTMTRHNITVQYENHPYMAGMYSVMKIITILLALILTMVILIPACVLLHKCYKRLKGRKKKKNDKKEHAEQNIGLQDTNLKEVACEDECKEKAEDIAQKEEDGALPPDKLADMFNLKENSDESSIHYQENHVEDTKKETDRLLPTDKTGNLSNSEQTENCSPTPEGPMNTLQELKKNVYVKGLHD